MTRTTLIKGLGLPAAGLIFLLEGVGVPVPVEIPLGIIGARMAGEPESYWSMVLLMWSTTVAGNTIGYYLGYYGGDRLILRLTRWLRIKPETWVRIDAWFRKHGLKVVVATRWINWGFAQNMWLCGITRVKASRFFPIMIVNDFLWAMAWIWLTMHAATWFQRHNPGKRFMLMLRDFLHDSTLRLGLTAVGLVLIGLGAYWLYRWWRNRQPRSGRTPRG